MKQLHLASLLLLYAGSATAVEYETVSAVGACQAALPVYDSSLRKKPLAVANQGQTTAFMSCAVLDHLAGVADILVSLKNRSAADAEVTCTFIDGSHLSEGTNTYFPKSVSVSAGTNNFIDWNYVFDNGGQVMFSINFSCALPAGVEMGIIQVTHGTE